MAIIRSMIQVLRSAPRLGEATDEPEGVRYIQISETLANLLADRLEAHLLMREPGYPPRCFACGVDLTDRMEQWGLKDPDHSGSLLR